jgi:type I restriction enzyme S subunit
MAYWSKIKLGNACQITKGVQFNKLDLENSGVYPCINGGISPSGYSDKWNTESETITISEGGNSCGYVNFLKTRFWSGGHCYSLLDIKEIVTKDFLYYALKGRESLIMNLRVGSGLPNIQQKEIKEFEFVYPIEKSEQTKIASILGTTDKAISETEKLIAKYQRIKTGLMQDLLTKGIDAKGNVRSKVTHRFVLKNGIEVPEEWEVDCLSYYSNLHNNLRKPISALERFNKKGIYPYYGATGIIDSIDEFRLDGKYVLIGEDGDHFLKFEKQEMTHLVEAKFNVSNHAHILSGKNGCLTEWIHYFFSHRDITFYLTRQGAGRFKLNKQALNNLPVCVPPDKEQVRIIKFIETFNSQFDCQKKNHLKLTTLKSGLMQDLLSGKVKVKNV